MTATVTATSLKMLFSETRFSELAIASSVGVANGLVCEFALSIVASIVNSNESDYKNAGNEPLLPVSHLDSDYINSDNAITIVNRFITVFILSALFHFTIVLICKRKLGPQSVAN